MIVYKEISWFYFKMKIDNVKTPVIELLFHHRDTEDSEKNREGVLYYDKHGVRKVGEDIKRIVRIRQDGCLQRSLQPSCYPILLFPDTLI